LMEDVCFVTFVKNLWDTTLEEVRLRETLESHSSNGKEKQKRWLVTDCF